MSLNNGFYLVDNRIFMLGLSPIQFIVYSYLVSCAGKKNECWPSYSTIAHACGINRNSVIRAVDVLVSKQLIEKHETKSKNKLGKVRQSNNLYFIKDINSIIGFDKYLVS